MNTRYQRLKSQTQYEYKGTRAEEHHIKQNKLGHVMKADGLQSAKAFKSAVGPRGSQKNIKMAFKINVNYVLVLVNEGVFLTQF